MSPPIISPPVSSWRSSRTGDVGLSVDNLTHSLLGLALARSRLGRRSPLSAVALVVAANLPDVDVVARLFLGVRGYLVYHRGITHALAGVVVLIGLGTWLFEWLERRRDPNRRGRCWRPSEGPFLAVAIGLATHPLLDLLNMYGLRPWLPFSAGWVYGDLVFIVDPWLWLILGGAAAIAGRRSGRGDVAWIVLALVATFFIYAVGGDRVSPVLRVIWPVALVLIGAVRAARLGDGRARWVLGLGGLGVAGYLTLLFVSRGEAERIGAAAVSARLDANERIVTRAMLPEPTRPRVWTVLAATERRVFWQPVRLGEPLPAPRVASRHLDRPEVAAIDGTAEAEAWHIFSRFPVAELQTGESGPIVRLSDARFWFTDWCTIEVPVGR